ncbi:mucosal addressin cell adhesion molecule 1 [Puma concolor]|uniref:Mucosal addressin cell adhesion molecule 1 n=1 Tax=Puma concolor TaxID=9696 RepID=A0A6P6H8R8_PUMCO|nr:mucosal addressin cell adhesion molecule 1 [Puma concolor]
MPRVSIERLLPPGFRTQIPGSGPLAASPTLAPRPRDRDVGPVPTPEGWGRGAGDEHRSSSRDLASSQCGSAGRAQGPPGLVGGTGAGRQDANVLRGRGAAADDKIRDVPLAKKIVTEVGGAEILHRLTSQEPPVTTSPKATPELSSTHSPRNPGPPPGNSSTRPCRPEIHQSPVPGGLELLCEAACGPGMSASWTQAPGGLEAYERQEAGALARLSVPWARCNPEGWFQCRLDPGGQMASLYLVPEICPPTTSAALWPGSLVLGLLFLAFLTHRLWRRCRPAG